MGTICVEKGDEWKRHWRQEDTMGVWMFKFTISCIYTYVYIYVYLNPDQTYERKTFIPHDLFCFCLYLSFRLSSSHVIFFLLATQNICICIYIHYIYTAYIYILHKIKASAICLSCYGLFGETLGWFYILSVENNITVSI